ncbi:MAG: hypothetical protein HY934_00315 [Candidatus Firestonebacteria bacterium]|nr:hypothetical protein [Candidatus Firestonebacteria bacterium]
MSTNEMVEEEELFERFTFMQLLNHVVLLVTFLLVVLTGFPQKFSFAPWADFLAFLFGGAEPMRKVHHTAGVIMVINFLFHSAYLVYRWISEGWKSYYNDFIMVPNPNDGWCIVQNFKYWLHLSDEPAEYDEIGWKEKLDYWAVYWGTAIFGLTGPMMWYPHIFSKFLPAWAIYVAWIVHSDEAVLATLVIFIWHFYNVHLGPERWPIGRVWYTGKLDTEELIEEHLGYYKELKGIPGATGVNRLRRGKVKNRDTNTGGFIPREKS